VLREDREQVSAADVLPIMGSSASLDQFISPRSIHLSVDMRGLFTSESVDNAMDGAGAAGRR
jgi:hypothetical protein